MTPDDHLTPSLSTDTQPPVPSWVQYVPSAIHDAAGFMLDNHVIGLGEGLSDVLRNDMMYSCMYAETIASNATDIRTDPQFWQEYYVDVLHHVGWEAKAPVLEEWTRHHHFTPEQTLLQVIQEAGGQRMGVVAMRTLGALQNNHPARQLLKQTSMGGQGVAFKLLPCIQSTEGNAIMVLTGVNASSWPALVSWLEDDEPVIQIQAQRMELNPRHHDHYREKVQNAVHRRSDQFFANLTL